MPDHTHLLLQPLLKSPGLWHSLSEIMKTVKGVSARRINQMLGTNGCVWEEESFDRIIRDQHEHEEKMQYMWMNPAEAGLVGDPEEWDFFIWPPESVA